MRFHHVAIQVDCVRTSIDWYVEHLRAKVLKQHDDWATLLINGLCLALTKRGTHPDHICFITEDINDFPCEEIDIKEHRDGSLYYYQQTPDGNVIEWLFWPKREGTF